MQVSPVFSQVNTNFESLKYDRHSYRRFIKNLKTTNIESQCIQANLIGRGANSSVYKFSEPNLDRWVIKVDTTFPDFTKSFLEPIKKIKDVFDGLNLGEAIAKMGSRIHILKRVNGKAHSVSDWAHREALSTRITDEEAIDFVNDVKNISEFPQKSFNKYAEKLNAINTNGYKADSFNPNNYLIDYDKKEINIIDFYKYELDVNRNTKYDLICPLLDYLNFVEIYNKVANKKDFLKAAKTIYEKCTIAAEKNNINCSEKVFTDYIADVDKRLNLGTLYSSSYANMKKIIGF